MEGKTGIYIVLVLAVILLLFSITFYFTRGASKSPSTVSNLETCNILKFNDESGVNVLFFSNEKDAEKYSDLLLSLSPFSENQNSFNFYYIKPEDFEATKYCELYQGIAILCTDKEIIKAAASCPHDYIAVVDNQAANIRSSAYKGVMSINSVSPIVVFAHEFGHVFANFAEEYVPATLQSGSKNCQSSCAKFKGDIDGCYEGCSKGNYIRANEASIMRTLTSLTFGTFNEMLLTNRLDEMVSKKVKSITGNQIFTFNQPNCRDSKYYAIEAKKLDGKFQIISTEVRTGCPAGPGATIGDISYDVYDANALQISKNQFSLSIFTDVQGADEISGKIYQNHDSFTLTFPVTGQESTVEISDAESSTTIDLQTEIGDANPCRI